MSRDDGDDAGAPLAELGRWRAVETFSFSGGTHFMWGKEFNVGENKRPQAYSGQPVNEQSAAPNPYANPLPTEERPTDHKSEPASPRSTDPERVQHRADAIKTNESKITDPRRKRRVNRDDFIAAGCTMSCPCRCYYCVNHVEWIYDDAPEEK